MIKLQRDEYENLLHETHELHNDTMEQIHSFITELTGLLVPEGGFHADLISEKVKLILDKFENDVVPKVDNTFSETEKTIRTFGNELAEADESGRTKVQWEE